MATKTTPIGMALRVTEVRATGVNAPHYTRDMGAGVVRYTYLYLHANGRSNGLLVEIAGVLVPCYLPAGADAAVTAVRDDTSRAGENGYCEPNDSLIASAVAVPGSTAVQDPGTPYTMPTSLCVSR